MSIAESAKSWARRGFRVFPITPGDKVPPKGLKWKQEATTDQDKITAWWAFNPQYNYAVATGSGTIVVDVDAHKGGYASLLDLDLPDTLAVKTPGGGLHLYFNGPDVQNSVDRVAPGVDIRSDGGYVVGPGSVFADPGGVKGYVGGYVVYADMEAAPAPASLVLRCGDPRLRSASSCAFEDEPDDIVFAMHYLIKDAPPAVSGSGGNSTTYAVAARVMEIGASEDVAFQLMAEHWNPRCAPPWDADDLRAIVAHASEYMLNSRGSGGVTAGASRFGDPVHIDPPKAASSAGKFDDVFRARELTPLERIPAREWVMHRLLLRNEASVLAGPGGVGKSGFSLALAAHGAVGADFAGFRVPKPFKTVVYNLEDSRHEMEARLYAVCATYGLDPHEVGRHVLLWPGRETRFRLMGKNHEVAMADVMELARLTKANGFDAIVLDPLVSLHHEEENDNTAMGEVMDALNGLARLSGTAALALHHTPKAVRQAGSSDAVRGAGNIVNSVRIASTIYAADEADAALYGFGDGYKARYVRVDDAKQNVSALDTKPLWLEKQSFPLPCGDTSYALRVMEPSATSAGEAKLIAEVLAAHMNSSGTMYLASYDAARVLASSDGYFRDRVPASGDLRQLKALVELRLSQAVQTDEGLSIRVVPKTEPGAQSARMFVELV